ncbi:MAG: hypothetical protein ACRDU8_00900, partial [Egibacteraceae bacterium]
AELALRAGADMVLLGQWGDTPEVTDRLVRAVRAGRLERKRLDAAVRRVLRLKGYAPERVDCLLG